MPQTPLYPVIRLNPGKDDALRRFHPWVFSGAIHDAAKGLQAGDTVTVTDYDGRHAEPDCPLLRRRSA